MKLDKYFAYAKEKGFTDFEFKTITKNTLSIQVFHKKVENYQISENEVIYLRGICNGNMVSGQSENKNNLEEIIDEMALNATLIDNKKEQEIFAGSEKYKNYKTYSEAIEKMSVNDKIAMCLKLEDMAYKYDARIVDVDEVSYEEVTSAMKIVNSKGLKLAYKVNYAMLVLSVVAKSDSDVRTSFAYQIKVDPQTFDLDYITNKACLEALNALDGVEIASKKYKVVLAPIVFASFVSFLLSSVSGEAVNKGKSLLKDKLNTLIASKKLSIMENPLNKNYPYFYRSFDDEGVATYKKMIIDKGVLKTFLYNIEAAKEAKVTSTGNGYGGSKIGIDTAFVEVKPGKKSLDELCQNVKNGVQITSVQGLHAGMNPLSGDFSLQASGYLIEDGKITKPINLITIAGNLFKMFADISEIGSDVFVTYGGLSTPSVVIKKLAISSK